MIKGRVHPVGTQPRKLTGIFPGISSDPRYGRIDNVRAKVEWGVRGGAGKSVASDGPEKWF